MGSSTATIDALLLWACTALSCCVSDALCLPSDLVKTRMQLQNELRANRVRVGVVEMFGQIYRFEGASAFYAGLPAAMLRQAAYGGLSFAMYPYLRDAMKGGQQEPSLLVKLVAGGISGGSASAVANPTDVVKVRMQADGRLALLGRPPRYNGLLHATTSIVREEGVAAFYKGLAPNVSRAFVVNAVGIASYDHTKHAVIELLGEEDSLRARFAGALIGGVATSIFGCPFDVLKTRMMNQWSSTAISAEKVQANLRTIKVHPALLHAHTKPLYASPLHCLAAIVQKEGVLALWKGVFPVYCRQAPFNLLNYMIMEQLTWMVLGRRL